jgi:hypothetical protein
MRRRLLAIGTAAAFAAGLLVLPAMACEICSAPEIAMSSGAMPCCTPACGMIGAESAPVRLLAAASNSSSVPVPAVAAFVSPGEIAVAAASGADFSITDGASPPRSLLVLNSQFRI